MFQIPKNRSVERSVWILLREEFLTSIGRVKTFQVLVVADSEDEIFLHHQQHLHNAYSMNIHVAL